MKIVYAFLIFLLSQTANAQDYCKQVKKESSPDGYTLNFISPYSEKKLPSIRVTRNVDFNPEDDGYDNFYVIFRIVGGSVEGIFTKMPDGSTSEKKENNMKVEFDDKTVMSMDTVRINHDLTDDKAEVIRTAFFSLSDDNIKNFMTKKIVRFELAGYERTFSADSANALMHYIKCIKAAR